MYVKAIGSEQITRLISEAADDLSPSWSPDGLNIAFLRFLSDQRAAVMIVPAAGGVERQLATIEVERFEPGIRVSWSPNGHWLATSDKETPLSRLKLILISTSTGAKRRLRYRPEPADADLNLVISPDERYIAFARHTSVSIADIYLLKLPTEDDPEPTARPLTLWKRLNRSPVWPSNSDLFFVGDEGQIGSRIWELPVFGGGLPAALKGSEKTVRRSPVRGRKTGWFIRERRAIQISGNWTCPQQQRARISNP